MRRNSAVISFCILSMGFFLSGNASADSTVTIHNDVNTSSSNRSSSQCHTIVHMMVNGQEQDMESDDCNHDVNVNNGNNSIHISNTTGGSVIMNYPQKAFPIPSPQFHQHSASQEGKMRQDAQRMSLQRKNSHHSSENLWTQFTAWLQDIFPRKSS